MKRNGKENLLTNKRILFEIAHPKHVYQFRDLINVLKHANDIFIVARDKGIVLDILNFYGLDYVIYGSYGKTITQKLSALPKILLDYRRFVSKYKPDLIISKSSPYAELVKVFYPVKTVIMPDAEVVPLINSFVAPRANLVITPNTFSLDFGSNHKRISSFFEYGYLHPNKFSPDPNVLGSLGVNKEENYFVCRFSSWEANHDLGKRGFSKTQKRKLLYLLSNHGKLFVSDESDRNREFNCDYLNIQAAKIHSVLYYASMYVGDSQSMATESALLGTPSFRFNSFVGAKDMTNFKVLEKAGMLENFNNFNNLLEKVNITAKDRNAKDEWLKKRKQFFSANIDIYKEELEYLDTLFVT